MDKLGAITAAIFLPLLLQACATASSAPDQAVGANAPVIDSIAETTSYDATGRMIVVPQFHFHDPLGRVALIHRELVSSTANRPFHVRDGLVRIPAPAQRRGGVILGGWHCGTATYTVHMRADLVTTDGRRSNSMDYTIRCNGG